MLHGTASLRVTHVRAVDQKKPSEGKQSSFFSLVLKNPEHLAADATVAGLNTKKIKLKKKGSSRIET